MTTIIIVVRMVARIALLSIAFLLAAVVLILSALYYFRAHPNNNADLAITPLKEFALAYDPKEEAYGERTVFGECQLLPTNIPHDVIDVLKHRTIDYDYKLYVLLVIIKLYNCHYETSGLGQGFNEFPLEDLWNFNPFYRAYVNIRGGTDEYLTTFDIVNWLYRHDKFMKDKVILEELKLTCSLYDKRNNRISFCDDLVQRGQ